jgi:hypothetical protein
MFTAWQPAVVPPEAEALSLLGPLHPPGHHAPGTGEAPTEYSATAWIVYIPVCNWLRIVYCRQHLAGLDLVLSYLGVPGHGVLGEAQLHPPGPSGQELPRRSRERSQG